MLQFTRFLDVAGPNWETEYHRQFAIRHCAASAAVLHYPCTHLDMVRPGIALYGHYPDPSCEGLDGPGLLPGDVAQEPGWPRCGTLPANTPVSYGCTGQARSGRRPAGGAARGLCRRTAPGAVQSRLAVWLAGKTRPIVGRVCMDMCMVGRGRRLPKWNQETWRRSLVPTLPAEVQRRAGRHHPV